MNYSDIVLDDIEEPAARIVIEHIQKMRFKDFARFCALSDLMDIVLNDAMPDEMRNSAVKMIQLDTMGGLDKLREAYMKHHDGKDGTEPEAQGQREKEQEDLKTMIEQRLNGAKQEETTEA